MSWMNLAGKIYHCLNCRREIKVEYEGGARLTQVSDPVIEEQKKIRKKYDPKSKHDFDKGDFPGVLVSEPIRG